MLSFTSDDLQIGGFMSTQKESILPLPPAPQEVRVISVLRGPLNLPPEKKKRIESRVPKQEESILPLPPAPQEVRVISVLRGPLNLPPEKKKSKPVFPKDEREILESLGITPSRDTPPPTPPPITVVSALGSRRPMYEENGERAPSENGGGKLAALALRSITFLRRLIKLVSRFLSRDASSTVESK